MYLGNKLACSNYVWVKENNITHIVNVTHHVKHYFEHDPLLHYCRIRCRLHSQNDDIHSDDEEEEEELRVDEEEEEDDVISKKRRRKQIHDRKYDLQQAFLSACSFIWSALSCNNSNTLNNGNICNNNDNSNSQTEGDGTSNSNDVGEQHQLDGESSLDGSSNEQDNSFNPKSKQKTAHNVLVHHKYNNHRYVFKEI